MTWIEFHKKLTELKYSESDIEFISRAFCFAKDAHEGQKRASGEPYFTHAAAVGYHITTLGLDTSTIAAALLHDTIEDCDTSREELEKRFGNDVAFLVEGVSKLSSVRYQGVQRKIESLRKMFLAFAKDVRVVLIKLSDRLHNMQTIQFIHQEKQRRIALETLEIYAPIAYRLGMGHMKGELEDLAFPIVHPDEYAWVKQELENRIPEGEQYLSNNVKPKLEEILHMEDIKPLTIDFRKKHLYSLWKKLLRYDMDFGRITDLFAMRVVVDTIEDCYQTFGIIHQLWKPLPGRIKDYIALPKPNGYRSIHTTVFCVDNKITEFQIRTHDMHIEAERGVAAHWAYTETNKPKHGGTVDQQMAWVRKLSDWQREFGTAEDSTDFLESLKIDFFKDRIFTLTPKGEVLDLPAGSTPVDFAYAVHTDIGNHMIGAKINGKLVHFDRELLSGETVEILTQKNRKPNAEWLSFVKSSFAKNRLRAALRKENSTALMLDSARRLRLHCQFTITAKDRVGLLKDISAVFSAFRINIQHITVNTKNKPYPDVVVSAQMRDSKQADSITTRLKNIRDVEEIMCKELGAAIK
jgi:GTP diphosphokinase / guanosine-3',5'-bis(diphosphate) 3'-diphosphatase